VFDARPKIINYPLKSLNKTCFEGGGCKRTVSYASMVRKELNPAMATKTDLCRLKEQAAAVVVDNSSDNCHHCSAVRTCNTLALCGHIRLLKRTAYLPASINGLLNYFSTVRACFLQICVEATHYRLASSDQSPPTSSSDFGLGGGCGHTCSNRGGDPKSVMLY
jgi:hypothetical protein